MKVKIILALVLVIIIIIGSIVVLTPSQPAEGDPQNFTARYQEMDWPTIESIAAGQKIYFHMWGGSEAINNYVNGYISSELAEKFNISLVMVPLADTADAVNKILSDKELGNTQNGGIDLVWINGENFRTLKEAQALFGPFAHLLPNRRYINPNSPTLKTDFGYPIEDYESPWGAARFVFIYNSQYVSSPPTSMEELVQWILDNPNRFTYPRLPSFIGSAFVRQVFYLASNYSDLSGPFDKARYSKYGNATWQLLNTIESSLWREGRTYPENPAQMQQLFANGEIWFDMDYNPSKAANLVSQGIYPETTRTYVLDSGTLGNTHFVAIPFNASNKAGAMVLANLLLSPEAQYQKSLPEVWGDLTVLTLSLLPPEVQQNFNTLPVHPSAPSVRDLDKTILPELDASWLTVLEQAWEQNVLLK